MKAADHHSIHSQPVPNGCLTVNWTRANPARFGLIERRGCSVLFTLFFSLLIAVPGYGGSHGQDELERWLYEWIPLPGEATMALMYEDRERTLSRMDREGRIVEYYQVPLHQFLNILEGSYDQAEQWQLIDVQYEHRQLPVISQLYFSLKEQGANRSSRSKRNQ